MKKDQKIPQIRVKGFTQEWNEYLLNYYLETSQEKNFDGLYQKEDVLSVSGDYGIVNQIEFQGRSFAGASVLNYGVVNTGDIVYTKSPLKENPYGIIKTNTGKSGIVSTLYAVYHPKEVTYPKFVQWYFENDDRLNPYLHPLVNKGAKNDMKVSADNALLGPVIFPDYAEQKSISNLLDRIQSIILNYEYKIKKFQAIKTSMLEKMFPKDGADVPEIRFKGFTGTWEQQKLDTVFTTLQNNTLSRSELSMEHGAAKSIHYGDVLVKLGENLNTHSTILPNIVDLSTISKFQKSFLKSGDIIIADTAEDETVGKCTEITEIGKDIVIAGLHTIPCRPLIKFALGYLGYYMNSPAYHNQLLPFMQGIKVTSISKSSLKETIIMYPQSIEEQKQIRDYFYNLDTLIQQSQQQLEKLQSIKKALLEKMFV